MIVPLQDNKIKINWGVKSSKKFHWRDQGILPAHAAEAVVIRLPVLAEVTVVPLFYPIPQMTACVAILGRNVCIEGSNTFSDCCLIICVYQNAPLYLKTSSNTSDGDSLKFHYIVHTALDVFEERGPLLSVRNLFISSNYP